MAATTTMTSISSGKTGPKELCSNCNDAPYTVICQCGAKFDYHCISQHVDHLNLEMTEQHRQVSEKLARINSLQEGAGDDFDLPHTLVENWVCIEIFEENSSNGFPLFFLETQTYSRY